MTQILLINPNISQRTTDMMVAIAQSAAPPGIGIVGATASHGPPMIVDPTALAASCEGVLAMGLRFAGSVAGMIVGAFGDPGLVALRRRVAVPVIGIAESAMMEAASGGRRFGIATVTPRLVGSIDAHVAALGLAHLYTGTRLTSGDPEALAAHPDDLAEALAHAVARCIREDGAQAVVIGGGPLGNAATALAPRFDLPVIAPIPAAIRRLTGKLLAKT